MIAYLRLVISVSHPTTKKSTPEKGALINFSAKRIPLLLHYSLLLITSKNRPKGLVKSEEVISKNRQTSVEICRFLAGVAGYSAPTVLPTAPSGCGISAVLGTSQSQKPIAAFEQLRRTYGSHPPPKGTKKSTPKRVLFLMAGVAGFEPTNAAVKVLCLTA